MGGRKWGRAAAGLLWLRPPREFPARLVTHGLRKLFPSLSPSFYSSKRKLSACTESLTHLCVPTSTATSMARNPVTWLSHKGLCRADRNFSFKIYSHVSYRSSFKKYVIVSVGDFPTQMSEEALPQTKTALVPLGGVGGVTVPHGLVTD